MTEGLIVPQFIAAHPDEAARVLEQFPSRDGLLFLQELPRESAARLLGTLSPSFASRFLEEMEPAEAGALLSIMPDQRAANLLRSVAAQHQPRIVEALPEEQARSLDLLLRFPEGTAGALMDSRIHTVAPDTTVEEARNSLERFAPVLYYYLYVLDRDHRLEGVLDLRELLLAAGEERVRSVMHPALHRISPYTGLEALKTHSSWRDYDALPVVEEAGLFLGAVRHRDLRRLDLRPREIGSPRSGIGSLMPLGEMYWLGLWDVFQSLATYTPGAPDPKESTHERE